MLLDYESPAEATPSVGKRFCLISLGSGVVGFLAWCLLDFAAVRWTPSRIHDFDWLMLLFPFVVGFVAAFWLSIPDFTPRVGLAIAAAVVASVIALTLILFIGVNFHFAIGGKL